MGRWAMPLGLGPGWWAQLRICSWRYLLKLVRTRTRTYAYFVVVVVLGALCGALHGAEPVHTERFIFYILYNAVYATLAATVAIPSLTHAGLDGMLFRHEAAAGVRPSAEATARILLDLLWFLAPLAPLFAIPTSALTTGLPLRHLLPIWWAFAYAVSPIGYNLALLAPSSAVVLTSSFSLVLTAFFNGFFGLSLTTVSETSRLAYPWLSSGYSAFLLLSYGAINRLPNSPHKLYLLSSLLSSRMLNTAEDGTSATSAFPRVDLEGEDEWYWGGIARLVVIGTVLRLTALILFVTRRDHLASCTRMPRWRRQGI